MKSLIMSINSGEKMNKQDVKRVEFLISTLFIIMNLQMIIRYQKEA